MSYPSLLDVAPADVTFSSGVGVELVQSMASDEAVVFAARVSTLGEHAGYSVVATKGDAGLVNYLMRDRHGSPFEHNSFTFRIKAPIVVWREFMRHRIGFSYNEESGRYRQLAPEFYVPGPERRLQQVGKVGRYTFVEGTYEQKVLVPAEIRRVCVEAYGAYQRMLAAGVAREVARLVLPVNLFSTAYVTCNARSLMAFLSLRTEDAEAAFPSHPQREIAMVAEQMETYFAEAMPVTHAAFNTHRRVAP